MNRRLGHAVCIAVAVAFLTIGQPWWQGTIAAALLVAASYFYSPDGAE
jgi:membrane protein implicated in regulation of membrane protease activity